MQERGVSMESKAGTKKVVPTDYRYLIKYNNNKQNMGVFYMIWKNCK